MDDITGATSSAEAAAEHAEMPDIFTIGNVFYTRKYARGCTCGWRSEFETHEYQAKEALLRHLNPGLHRTGPNPWDFEYNPREGELLSIQLASGELMTGVITEVVEGKETGEMQITAKQFPDAPRWIGRTD